MKKTAKIIILISGRGSNMESLIKSSKETDSPFEIIEVISNKSNALGLEKAKNFGISTLIIESKGKSQKDFENELKSAILAKSPDYICLAGFMKLLSADFLSGLENKVINIHPSLLPKHKGLNAQKQALEAGDKESGCTVHFVTAQMDGGEIILQKKVPIIKGDTEDSLSQRILGQEHLAYSESLRKIIAKNS